MKQELLTLAPEAIQLLETLADGNMLGVQITGMRGRLSDVAELVGLHFVKFDEGTLVVLPRGTRFLELASRHEDGSASVAHDDLGRDFTSWPNRPTGPT